MRSWDGHILAAEWLADGNYSTSLIARPTGPRWAPCWPHKLCYLWRDYTDTVTNVEDKTLFYGAGIFLDFPTVYRGVRYLPNVSSPSLTWKEICVRPTNTALVRCHRGGHFNIKMLSYQIYHYIGKTVFSHYPKPKKRRIFYWNGAQNKMSWVRMLVQWTSNHNANMKLRYITSDHAAQSLTHPG